MSSEQFYYVCTSCNKETGECAVFQRFTKEDLKAYLEELAPDVEIIYKLGFSFINLETDTKKVFIIKGSLVSAIPTEVKKTKWVIKEE